MQRHASITLATATLDTAATSTRSSSNISPPLSGSSFRKRWDVSAAFEIHLPMCVQHWYHLDTEISIANHHHQRQLSETQTRCLPKKKDFLGKPFLPGRKTRPKALRKCTNRK